jgi:hypothetical protein
MKLPIALLLASLPLLAVGGEGLYHAAASREQTTLTCDQLAEAQPRVSWLKLTGCELDYATGAGIIEEDGAVSELFFPIRPAGGPDSAPALMVAATRDPQVLAIAESARDNQPQTSQEAHTVMMLRIVTALHAAREIEGSVRRGLLDAARTRRTLSAVTVPVAPGALVLDLNERRESGVAVAVAGAGLVLLIAGLMLLVLRRPTSVTPPMEGEQASLGDVDGGALSFEVDPMVEEPAPAREAAGGSRLKGLMLLNLGPTAGRAAIEDAPPLGEREEVLRMIGDALPGVAFDERGRGTLAMPDGSITIDLGPGDIIWTAVLDVRGETAADALLALVRGTGWRVYQPRRGDFVDVNELQHS